MLPTFPESHISMKLWKQTGTVAKEKPQDESYEIDPLSHQAKLRQEKGPVRQL